MIGAKPSRIRGGVFLGFGESRGVGGGGFEGINTPPIASRGSPGGQAPSGTQRRVPVGRERYRRGRSAAYRTRPRLEHGSNLRRGTRRSSATGILENVVRFSPNVSLAKGGRPWAATGVFGLAPLARSGLPGPLTTEQGKAPRTGAGQAATPDVRSTGGQVGLYDLRPEPALKPDEPESIP